MALSFYDVDKKSWIAEHDEFTIYIGSSSRDIKLTKIFFKNRIMCYAKSLSNVFADWMKLFIINW